MRVRFNIDFEVSPVQAACRQRVPVFEGVGDTRVDDASNENHCDGHRNAERALHQGFSALDQRIAKLEALAAKENVDGGRATGATYCGAAPNAQGVKSAQLGTPAPTGWYSGGAAGTGQHYDCVGWSDFTVAQYGTAWNGTAPSFNTCDTSYAVLCCD